MSELKSSLLVARIDNADARRFLARHHRLGAGAAFRFALGVFWQGTLQGVLSFGQPGMSNSAKSLGLAAWQVLELRKMVCTDTLPRNSESRALAIATRLIRRDCPHVAALMTFCEADERAAAYKAAGWKALQTTRYVSRYKVDGNWYTFRDANRYGLAKRATEREYVEKTKLVLRFDGR